MNLDRMSVDGGGAMEDEQRSKLEQEFIRIEPSYRYNKAGLHQLVDAVIQGVQRTQQQQPSDPEKSFFNDMQGWYSKNAMPRLGQDSGQRPSDALDSTGNLKDSDLSPLRGLATGFATENGGGANLGNSHTGNADPNDQSFGAQGKTVADDEHTPGGGPKGGGAPWIRSFPAAGRFGARRR